MDLRRQKLAKHYGQDVSALRFEIHCMQGFRHLQHLFLLFSKTRLIKKSEWATHRESAKIVFTSQSVRDIWYRKKEVFYEDFRLEFTKMVNEIDGKDN